MLEIIDEWPMPVSDRKAEVPVDALRQTLLAARSVVMAVERLESVPHGVAQVANSRAGGPPVDLRLELAECRDDVARHIDECILSFARATQLLDRSIQVIPQSASDIPGRHVFIPSFQFIIDKLEARRDPKK